MDLKYKIIALVVLSNTSFVLAQDNIERTGGENGINRRVVSPYGYGGVKGIFSEPEIEGLQIRRTGAVSALGYDVNNIKDVPQMYFGVQGLPNRAGHRRGEIDAGITWEKLPTFRPPVGVITDYTEQGGWKVFVRLDGSTYVPGIPHNPLLAKNNLGSMKLEFALSGVNAVLTWNSAHSNSSFPYRANPLPTTPLQRRVKRVVALTQFAAQNPALKIDYNGQKISDVSFTEGKVAPLIISGGRCSVGTYIDWSLAVSGYKPLKGSLNVQQRTKLFAPHFVPAGRKGASLDPKVSRVIISDKRQENGDPAADISLFDAETVSIDVGSAAKVTADQLKFIRSRNDQ